MSEAAALPLAEAAGARVSVIVPAYQAAPFLDAALASLAGQIRRPDEVVVVDDASTDDTARIAERWAGVLPLVLVRNRVNLGLGASRRVGIERSTGELLSLLDADDVVLPDHLEVLVGLWERHGGIVVPEGYRWVPGRRLGSRPFTGAHVPPPAEQAHRILTHHFGCYCSLFSRVDYERSGGFRPLRRSEDWDLFVRMVRGGATMTVAHTPTLVYRRRPDSLSAGDGCIDANIELLDGLLAGDALAGDLLPDERHDVEVARRRLEARRLLLAGYAEAAGGDTAAARRLWVRAAVTDRGVRSAVPGMRGSTSLRALVSLATPQHTLRRRGSRLRDARRLTR